MKLCLYHEPDYDNGEMNPYRYIDFADALRLMKSGYSAVRDSWGDDLKYLTLGENGVFFQHGEEVPQPYDLKLEDITAEDWYLANVILGYEYGDDEYGEDLVELGFKSLVNNTYPTILRTPKEIHELCKKYFDLSWYYTDARLVSIYKEQGRDYVKDMESGIRKGRNDAKKRLKKKYKLGEPYSKEDINSYIDDYAEDRENHAYMAALRWVTGSNEWMLDT